MAIDTLFYIPIDTTIIFDVLCIVTLTQRLIKTSCRSFIYLNAASCDYDHASFSRNGKVRPTKKVSKNKTFAKKNLNNRKFEKKKKKLPKKYLK